MNVLSLFDGISCAMIALKNLGVKVDNYFASEIDVHAIKVSKLNFPNIKHIGDIRNINTTTLPKIDLLIGGSPCQDLSNAQIGLGLEGDKSSLFFEYIRILYEVNPKYFILENVKNKWGSKMSEFVGVHYVSLNSSYFSAQSRPRYYWTNIKYPTLPNKTSSEILQDIIENKVEDQFYFNKQGLTSFISKTNYNDSRTKDGLIKVFDIPKEIINDNERQRRVYSTLSKSPTILARTDTTKILVDSKIRKLTPLECERLQKIPDNYTSIESNSQRYKMIGNAFTVTVIEHFLKGLNNDPMNIKKSKNLLKPINRKYILPINQIKQLSLDI